MTDRSTQALMACAHRDPNERLPRKEIALALTQAGFPVSPKTLATYATRGGGPVFRKFGRKPLYRWGDALEWAQEKLSKPVRSTSELRAA